PRGKDRTELHDEHDRVARHGPRVKLADRVAERATHDPWVPERDASFLRMTRHQKVRPSCMRRCSTTGPRLSAGKNVSAPTITITPTSSPLKSGVVTGNVPSEGGICFLR